MVGHSLGGAATLLAAGDVPTVRAVAAVAAPFSPDHVRHLFAEDDIESALASGSVTVKIAGRPFQISAEFFHDLERHCSPERIAALERPLLVVHGTADRVVGIETTCSCSNTTRSGPRRPSSASSTPSYDRLPGGALKSMFPWSR
jgi:putative redox protein